MVRTQDVDTELLNMYIRNSGLKIGFIVETLGISRQVFDKKRKGIVGFRAPEVYVLCDMLKIPNEDKTKIFCVEG